MKYARFASWTSTTLFSVSLIVKFAPPFPGTCGKHSRGKARYLHRSSGSSSMSCMMFKHGEQAWESHQENSNSYQGDLSLLMRFGSLFRLHGVGSCSRTDQSPLKTISPYEPTNQKEKPKLIATNVAVQTSTGGRSSISGGGLRGGIQYVDLNLGFYTKSHLY